MGMGILIIGNSGSGKSTSMRNFGKDEITLINVNGKPMPFRGGFTDTYNTDNYDEVAKLMKNQNKKIIVLDDVQCLLSNEFMRRAHEKGYDKFTEMGERFWTLVKSVSDLPEDVLVYFLGHTQTDDSGIERFKTIGKMLDEKIFVEGMFSVVLKTVCSDGKYFFTTNTNGHDTVKSPMGMFASSVIDNDLKAVDDAVRNYYSFTPPEICEDCGREIRPFKSYTVTKLVEGGIKAYGRKLCWECCKKAKASKAVTDNEPAP